MSEVDYLRRASDLIRRHGWTQFKLGRTCGGFCLVGALVYVHSLEGQGVNSYHGAVRRLSRILGTANLSAWNDAEGRTQEEVLDALEKSLSVISGG